MSFSYYGSLTNEPRQPPPYQIKEVSGTHIPSSRHHRLAVANPRSFPFGLAVVHKRASDFPEHFQGWEAKHMPMVTDVPVGQVVMCLPYEHTDIFWRAVIVVREVEGEEMARLTWMHPECMVPLVPHPTEVAPIVKIEHTKGRGGPPSVLVPKTQPGIKWSRDNFHTCYAAPPPAGPRGRLLLDARWDDRSYGVTDRCSGYCLALCTEIILNPRNLAMMIRFAELSLGEEQSYVCCAHAKHRSVSVGVMLQIMMRFHVDFTEAASDRSSNCCGESALANAASILSRLREVPMLHCPSTTLAHSLNLKEWKSAFWGDFRRFVPY